MDIKKYNVDDLYKVQLAIVFDGKLTSLKMKQQYFIATKEVDWLRHTYFYLVTQHDLELNDDYYIAGEGGMCISESTPLALEHSINKKKLSVSEIEKLEEEINSKQVSSSTKKLKYVDDFFEYEN